MRPTAVLLLMPALVVPPAAARASLYHMPAALTTRLRRSTAAPRMHRPRTLEWESLDDAVALRVADRYFPHHDMSRATRGTAVDVFKIHGIPSALVEHADGRVHTLLLNKGMLIIFDAQAELLRTLRQRYERVDRLDLSFFWPEEEEEESSGV